MRQARILIIDDDPDYLEILAVTLAGAGFQRVATETDALKAAGRIDAGEPVDVALIDLTMPEIDRKSVV